MVEGTDLCPIERLVKHLEELLQEPDSHASVNRALDVLFDLNVLGLTKHKFSIEEKTEIGPLLKQVMSRLEYCVRTEVFQFPTSSFVAACTVRSGVQYLLQFYKDFPVDNVGSTLDLHMKELLVDIVDWEEYDECFKEFQDDPYAAGCNLTEARRLMEKKMRSDHWWWWSDEPQK